MLASAVFGLLWLLSACGATGGYERASGYIDPGCPPIQSLGVTVPGDLVHSRKAALEIAKAVIDSAFSPEALRRFTGIGVEEQEKVWLAYPTLPKDVYGGGGQFMIDKCTGQISEFTFSE